MSSRATMRLKAFEAGVDLVEDPVFRAQILAAAFAKSQNGETVAYKGQFPAWPALAPLTPDERKKVLSDVQEFAKAEEERIRTAQGG